MESMHVHPLYVCARVHPAASVCFRMMSGCVKSCGHAEVFVCARISTGNIFVSAVSAPDVVSHPSISSNGAPSASHTESLEWRGLVSHDGLKAVRGGGEGGGSPL